LVEREVRLLTTPLRVLLIEDSEDDALLAVLELLRAGYVITSRRVETAAGLVDALEHERWDLAIADFSMPQFSGTKALAILRQYDAEMPFVFVSGTIAEDAAVAAMKVGAQDYVMKGSLKRLVPAVERELREVEVRRSRRRAEERLAHLAYHDALTDLPNRALLHDRLTQAMLGYHREGQPLALMVLDLDNFKAINDSLGHQAGDRVLQQVALRLRAALRDTDTVARLGSDEFALLLPHTDLAGAEAAADKILQRLTAPYVLDDRSLVVAASLGLAIFPQHSTVADTLLQQADIAMYAAKDGGVGVAVYSADRDRQAHRRLHVISDLREAIDRDHFACYYQPIVDLSTGAIAALEVLARWQHPSQGLLPPSEFIELAEQTGLIEPLTLLLLDKALGEWHGADGAGIPIAVNLSARHLRDPNLAPRIDAILGARGVPPTRLVLEITENFIMSDPVRSIGTLTRLHEMGVTLALDDFGTGYSSLSYLRRLPLDELKIDRSFVMGLVTEGDAIVRSTIELAHNLGLTVVAEGVESSAICDRLRDLGCDAGQGTFIAAPHPCAVVKEWLGVRPWVVLWGTAGGGARRPPPRRGHKR
jgi:diguanylate cyclase (GGDEF)-like protein